MAPGINTFGPHTTQQDIDSIKAHFGNNYEAIDSALLTGVTGNFAVEDLIVARYELSGELPAFMVAGSAEMPSPDEASWLWQDAEIDTYKYWQNNDVKLKDAMNKLLAQMPVSYQDIIDNADNLGSGEESLATEGTENGSAAQAANDGTKGLDFSKHKDLQDFISSQVMSGNMSGALTTYAVYSFGPYMQDANEEIMYKYEEGTEHINELIDDLSSLDSESPTYAADSQRINMQINMITETNKTLLSFVQQLHDMKLEIIEQASANERSRHQTTGSIIGNMA